MSDFSLRFPDEPTAFAAAQALDAVAMTENGPRLVRFTHRYAIDVIGEIPETIGWHVNFRILDGTDLPEDLQQYVVYPENPYRVWA